jgi:hypothetical protein
MPMRVIAKKRCRAMFEPPEKGERIALNLNLSTRLKPTFFPIRPLGGWGASREDDLFACRNGGLYSSFCEVWTRIGGPSKS